MALAQKGRIDRGEKMKITIEIEDVRETPNGKNRVICSVNHPVKNIDKSDAYKIAMKAVDLIDIERRKI